MNTFFRSLALCFWSLWTQAAVSSPLDQVLQRWSSKPSFRIDFENNGFLKDGEPFSYISGSMHYFRVVPEYWEDRMVKMRYAGLNALETYIEWSSHEPEPSKYDFSGRNDFERFIRTAQRVGLQVILRLGPYIDAERDMGGFPYWLLSMNPHMKLRTFDKTYRLHVERWFKVLLPKVKPLLYSNGGPIIMVQVENEYGSYSACDFEYTTWLRDLIRSELGSDVVLFTTDGDGDAMLKCGKIDQVYTTVDFGTNSDVYQSFRTLRRHQSSGPLVNSEFYPGWLDHWGEPHSSVATTKIVETMNQMLDLNASFNFYMFEGGTSFEFGSGANFDTKYKATPTSYDYDAPLSEAGDPTEKYFAIRSAIAKRRHVPPGPAPVPSTKMALGPIRLKKVGTIFDYIDEKRPKVVRSHYPLSFEALGQRAGFVLYTTRVVKSPTDPVVLSLSKLRDRALIFVDFQYQGTLSRAEGITALPINCKVGSRLDILVENQGRVCYGDLVGETKGIAGATLGRFTLTEWNQTLIFKNWSKEFKTEDWPLSTSSGLPACLRNRIPSFYVGHFQVETLQDTFLNIDSWGKGIAVINGQILGRYWPQTGPQKTLYVPKTFLRPFPAKNNLVLFELEHAPCEEESSCAVNFVRNHVINGTTPSNWGN